MRRVQRTDRRRIDALLMQLAAADSALADAECARDAAATCAERRGHAIVALRERLAIAEEALVGAAQAAHLNDGHDAVAAGGGIAA